MSVPYYENAAILRHGNRDNSDGENDVETPPDGSQVSPSAGNGAGGYALPAIEPLEGGGAILAELARAVEHDLSTPDHAPATERAYAHDWADFAAFCGRYGLAPLPATPAKTLALYLKALETQRSRSPAGLAAGTVGLSLPTLRRRLAAIASRHATARLETPTEHSLVRRLLRRYSRARGTAVRKKEQLLIEQLPAILIAMPDDQLAIRDRALLLLGYAGAFRRSELVALDVEQLRFSRAGCYVWIASAKNGPRKKGRELFVPRLPAASTKAELCAVAARALARDRRAGRAGLSDVRFAWTAHGHAARPGRRRTDPSATDRDGGCYRRLRGAFAAARFSSRTPRRRRSRSRTSSGSPASA